MAPYCLQSGLFWEPNILMRNVILLEKRCSLAFLCTITNWVNTNNQLANMTNVISSYSILLSYEESIKWKVNAFIVLKI